MMSSGTIVLIDETPAALPAATAQFETVCSCLAASVWATVRGFSESVSGTGGRMLSA